MDNIDKLQEKLQILIFIGDWESKHTIEKQTKNSFSKTKRHKEARLINLADIMIIK